MKTTILLTIMLLFTLTGYSQTGKQPEGLEKDLFDTGKGKIALTFIGHGTLMMEAGKTVIHIDPVSREADYTRFPKANLILVTHEHGDHLDLKAIETLSNPETKVVASQSCSEKLPGATIMKNGDVMSFGEVTVRAVPAYNIVNQRNGNPYHPKGNGNGYILSFGGKNVYVAGDTENIPEMKEFKNIDIAFLPMNLPYTMTPEMVAEGAKSFHPHILYPYHMGETDPAKLVDLLKGSDIEVRIRKMK